MTAPDSVIVRSNSQSSPDHVVAHSHSPLPESESTLPDTLTGLAPTTPDLETDAIHAQPDRPARTPVRQRGFNSSRTITIQGAEDTVTVIPSPGAGAATLYVFALCPTR